MADPHDNPYTSPQSEPPRKQSADPSLEHEPHLRAGGFKADPSELRAEPVGGASQADELSQHSVWDEPALTGGPAPPPEAVTYASWLTRRRAATDSAATWWTTFWAALAAGPWAILGAIMGGQGAALPVMLVLIGPLTEEVMKIGTALLVVETRPFLFRSRSQVLLCAVAGGLVFATIENVLYLTVYIASPSADIILWRWTVCVALHTSCSFIAGLGVARVWSRTWRDLSRPRLEGSFPFLIAAVVVHGAYNGMALLFELTQYRF
jgi:hypothetical protein